MARTRQPARAATPMEQHASDANRVERLEAETLAERRRTVAQGLLAGMSQAEMARHFGVNRSTICDDVKVIRAQWREDQNATYQEYVDQEVMRLERLTLAYWERALGNPATRIPGNFDAAKIVLQCIDRKVRLLGLDAPERHVVSVTNDTVAQDISDKLSALAASLPPVTDLEEEDGGDAPAS